MVNYIFHKYMCNFSSIFKPSLLLLFVMVCVFPMGWLRNLKKPFWHIKSNPNVKYIFWPCIHLNGCVREESFMVFPQGRISTVQRGKKGCFHCTNECTRSDEGRFFSSVGNHKKNVYASWMYSLPTLNNGNAQMRLFKVWTSWHNFML